MRINCPHCGSRDASEFVYRGAAAAHRPDPNASNASMHFYEAVYVRDNPAGLHDEHWYHGAGCRSWLRVRRDTRSHEILSVELARKQALIVGEPEIRHIELERAQVAQ